MSLYTAATLVTLLFAQVSGGEEPSVIPGTNVAMDLHEIFQWDRPWNTHSSPTGKGNMPAYYLRLPLDKAVERLRPRILRLLPVGPPDCEVDKEWSEGEDKHYLICHRKIREDWETRTYALFIATQSETYAVVSRMNPDSGSDTEAKVLAAYQSSRISERSVDIRSALP